MASTKDFHDYVMDCLTRAGDVTSRKMMGEYCLYCQGKVIGDICDNTVFIKRTETSDRLLAGCSLQYPYEGSKTLMYVVEDFEDIELMEELLEGLYRELPEKKAKKK